MRKSTQMSTYTKPILRLLAAAICLAVVSACGNEVTEQAGPSGNPAPGVESFNLPDLGGREITIAVENAYPPFNFIRMGEETAKGWDYDVIGEICRRLNCTPVWVELRWDFIMDALAEGLVDMAGEGVTIIIERAEVVAFSDPYLTINQRLLVRSSENRFASIDDFVADEALLLGGQAETYNTNTAFDLVGEARVVTFESFEEVIDALVQGEIDGIIYDELEGLGYFGPSSESIEFIDDPLTEDGLGFIFNKESDLVSPFNEAIRTMMDDGFLQRTNWTWFGPEFNVTLADIELGAYAPPTPAPY